MMLGSVVLTRKLLNFSIIYYTNKWFRPAAIMCQEEASNHPPKKASQKTNNGVRSCQLQHLYPHPRNG